MTAFVVNDVLVLGIWLVLGLAIGRGYRAKVAA